MKTYRISYRILLLLVAVSLAAPVFGQSPASPLSPAERSLDSRVKADTIREVTTRLAQPDLEGRGTAQPGGDRAAKYLAEKFASLGFKPLGDSGGYLQSIKFKVAEVGPETAVRAGDTALAFGDDFVFAPPFPEADQSAAGSLVSIGFGVVSEELKRDDLAGLDLKGKIVAVLGGGPPKGVDGAAWAKVSSNQAVITRLMGKGIAGVILLNFGTKDQPYSIIQQYLTRRQVSLADGPRLPFKLPPILVVSDQGAEKLFAGSGLTYSAYRDKAMSGEAVSMELGKALSIDAHFKRQEGTSNNVAGIMEGSDPSLKDEAVVYSAHYDAYGILAGKIYPGAADNALGVGQMMAIADAFAKSNPRPRRSIILLAFTGEEAGLLGAEYWVAHPTWPLAKVAADLNFDGIGTETWGPVKHVIGYGADESDIGKLLESVSSAEGATIVPDPFPEEGAFYRSDHFAFVKKGIPGLMALGGPGGDDAAFRARAKKWLVTDYHMPTDTVRPDWNWQGPRTMASIVGIIGNRIANADTMPAWLPSSRFKKDRPAAPAPAKEAGR